MNFDPQILVQSLYGKLNYEPHWYALTTRNRHEKKVADRLQQKGITTYLPLYTTIRFWSDRKKQVTEPMFSCYVFVKIALQDRLAVLQTDGAARLVAFNQVPVPIPEKQIEAIRYILEEQIPWERAENWQAGQRVVVTHGPFKGVQGILQKVKGQSRLIMAIEGINQAISVEIDAAALELVAENFDPTAKSIASDYATN